MEDASRSDLVIGRNTYLKLGKKKKIVLFKSYILGNSLVNEELSVHFLVWMNYSLIVTL